MTNPIASAIADAARVRLEVAGPVDVARVWTPHPGPQTAFVNSTAYEVLYGGAAGGGKTDALLYGPLDQIHIPSCRVLFLRRTFRELREVMDRALGKFRLLGGVWRESEKRWTFPSGATYEFGYCESYPDVFQYQGQEYTEICYDELGQCPEERVWTYLISRNRATTGLLRRRMRASANPGGPGHVWLKRRFVDLQDATAGPSVVRTDGLRALTRAFIPARLADNPTLELGDPLYRQRLEMLPEITRRQLLEGDWSAGEGMALSELNRDVHLVAPFDVPVYWYQWGALDWGFNHPFWSGWFAADTDGNAALVDSVTGRRMLPREIAQRIAERIPTKQLRKFVAGHDCWNEVKARGENTPSIADQFREEGILLQRANISRASGLNNMRHYLTHGPNRPPRFRIMDTPNNRRVFECLESMVVDPDDPEDALKVDADEYGQGGDDAYDMTRYGLAARPLVAREPEGPEVRAFDPEMLKADVERQYKPLVRRAAERAKLRKFGKGTINPF